MTNDKPTMGAAMVQEVACGYGWWVTRARQLFLFCFVFVFFGRGFDLMGMAVGVGKSGS